jgi:hypothetical protein
MKTGHGTLRLKDESTAGLSKSHSGKYCAVVIDTDCTTVNPIECPRFAEGEDKGSEQFQFVHLGVTMNGINTKESTYHKHSF